MSSARDNRPSAAPPRGPSGEAKVYRLPRRRPQDFTGSPRPTSVPAEVTARIYRPSRTAMQSGEANARDWIVEFEPRVRPEIDPLMGWVGSRDPQQQVQLRFPDKESAVGYARRHGLAYVVQEPHGQVVRPKSYADNFRPVG